MGDEAWCFSYSPWGPEAGRTAGPLDWRGRRWPKGRLTPGPLRFTAGGDKHSETRDGCGIEETEDRLAGKKKPHAGFELAHNPREGTSRCPWLPPCLPPGPTCCPLCPISSPQLSWSVNRIRLLAALQRSEGSAEIQTLYGGPVQSGSGYPSSRALHRAPDIRPLVPSTAKVTLLPAPLGPSAPYSSPQNPASMSLPQGPPPWPPPS